MNALECGWRGSICCLTPSLRAARVLTPLPGGPQYLSRGRATVHPRGLVPVRAPHPLAALESLCRMEVTCRSGSPRGRVVTGGLAAPKSAGPKGASLGLMLCCCQFQVLNNFLTERSYVFSPCTDHRNLWLVLGRRDTLSGSSRIQCTSALLWVLNTELSLMIIATLQKIIISSGVRLENWTFPGDRPPK